MRAQFLITSYTCTTVSGLKFVAKTIIHKVFYRPIVTGFHYLYYTSAAWHHNKFLGYPILQCPLDLQIYQELIFRLKPAYIVQTGICYGGSIVYFASLLDLVGGDPNAVVVGIDIFQSEEAATIKHPRVRQIIGDSVAAETVNAVKACLPANGPGVVVLDSDHSCEHVYRELKAYADLVTVGSYLVVEDTNANGRPVNWKHGPGPYEAMVRFMKEDDRFVQDNELWKRNHFSFHHHGWLKRVR
jgi:cephalosporin hydroxylase